LIGIMHLSVFSVPTASRPENEQQMLKNM